jgi:parvulin-like peptidyl-prolyl isomerase
MDGGWHIIKVLDIREPRIPTLEQIREPLVKQMREERARAETESFLGGLLDENPIAINELVISRLMPASTN